MAREIDYSSLVRFIKEDIVEDRIPTAFRNGDLHGGMDYFANEAGTFEGMTSAFNELGVKAREHVESKDFANRATRAYDTQFGEETGDYNATVTFGNVPEELQKSIMAMYTDQAKKILFNSIEGLKNPLDLVKSGFEFVKGGVSSVGQTITDSVPEQVTTLATDAYETLKKKAFIATSWMIIHPYYAAAIGGAITVSVIVVGAGIIQYSKAKNNLANVESRYIIPIINKSHEKMSEAIKKETGLFIIPTSSTSLKDWMNSDKAKTIEEKRRWRIACMNLGNDNYLSEEIIHAYVVLDYNTRVQKVGETNIDYYTRIDKDIKTLREERNKSVTSPNLFISYKIESDYNALTLNVAVKGDLAKFVTNINSGAIATSFLQFITTLKLPCLKENGGNFKLYTEAEMKAELAKFINGKNLNLITTLDLAQVFCSDFLIHLYNVTMKIMLEKSLKNTFFLDEIKTAIGSKTESKNFKGLEIKNNTSDYPNGANAANSAYLTYLEKVAYLEWLTKCSVLIGSLSSSLKQEYNIVDVQRKIYEQITTINTDQSTWYERLASSGLKAAAYGNEEVVKSLTTNYELYLCSLRMTIENQTDIQNALMKQFTQQKLGQKLNKTVLNGIFALTDEIDKYRGTRSSNTGKVCEFDQTELQKRLQTEITESNFNMENYNIDSTTKDKTNINIQHPTDAQKDIFAVTNGISGGKNTNKSYIVKLGSSILIAVCCLLGLYYYNSVIVAKQKIKPSSFGLTLKVILAVLAGIGLYKSEMIEPAIKWIITLSGYKGLLGGANKSIYEQAKDAVVSAKDAVVSGVTNLFSSTVLTNIGFSQNMSYAIIGLGSLIVAIGGVAIFQSLLGAATTETPQENIAALEESVRSGRSYSKEAGRFHFNVNTGKIELVTGFRPPSQYNIKISQGSHFGIDNIYMQINTDGRITYIVGGTEVDSLSYIENKPVQTALVLAYLIKDKHFSRLTTKSSTGSVGEPENYKFHFEDDGTLILTKKENNVDREVASVSMVLRQQMTNDSKQLVEAAENKKQVCNNLFGAEESEYCTKHFHSILGKAGLNMLQNLGDAISSTSILNALNNAEVNVQYEILKNLDWKMKISNGKKTMVTVDEWVNRLKSDSRSAIVKYGESYEKFFNKQDSGSQIKTLLENMVNRINNNSRLLQEKYQEAVQQSTTSTRRRRRLSSEQISKLRSQVISENNILNTPFPIPGRPGALGYALQPLIGGGSNSFFSDKYKQAFDTIKISLSGYNQKLSSKTQSEIEGKLKKIEDLETDLSNLHKKINKYTQILKTEKNARIGRNVSENDIDDLINQYATNSKKQSRYIATITTAFGKIRMLLDKQEMGESMNEEKTYYSNL